MKLISILANEGDLSPSDIQKCLELKHRPIFRVNYLHPALENGFIERTIPDKPNSRLQKYHLTEKGAEILNQLGNEDTE